MTQNRSWAIIETSSINSQDHSDKDPSMFRTGYILTRRQDSFWFLALPFLAIAFALASQQWMTGVALVTVGMWITTPHQFASWLRTYGLPEERKLWGDRLYIGPLLLFASCLAGFKWAPITTATLVIFWDHQHSIMQQHGFARIYDFKGQTGAPSTGRFDLILGWVLFSNMLITSKMFMWPMVRELYRLRIPVSPEIIELVVAGSWWILGVYSVIYLGHITWSLSKGYSVNPVKYVFIGCSYFLWYYCAWHTSSVLIWGIAHKIMHGAQYMVIVYWYLRRQTQAENSQSQVAARLVRRGNVAMFVLVGLLYSVLIHILTGGQIGAFLFGWARFPTVYEAIPALGIPELSVREGYAFVSLALMNTFGITHYYFDSFIWKVRDRRIQKGLE